MKTETTISYKNVLCVPLLSALSPWDVACSCFTSNHKTLRIGTKSAFDCGEHSSSSLFQFTSNTALPRKQVSKSYISTWQPRLAVMNAISLSWAKSRNHHTPAPNSETYSKTEQNRTICEEISIKKVLKVFASAHTQYSTIACDDR